MQATTPLAVASLTSPAVVALAPAVVSEPRPSRRSALLASQTGRSQNHGLESLYTHQPWWDEVRAMAGCTTAWQYEP
jgi:hypothetical protein